MLQVDKAYSIDLHCCPNQSPDAHKTEAEKAADADAEILAAITSRRKLASHMELAKGVQYSESIQTSLVLYFLLLNL